MRRHLVALGATLAIGCAELPAPSAAPAQAVAELAAALRSGDAEALAARTGRTATDVLAAQADASAELQALGLALQQVPVDQDARVTLSDGSAIVLVRDGESWRVDRGVLGRPALATPTDAVIALHAALARSRVEAVLALLARGARAEAESELARYVDGTADPDALDVSVSGEQATVRTPTGEQIELVRESGEWHVVELR